MNLVGGKLFARHFPVVAIVSIVTFLGVFLGFPFWINDAFAGRLQSVSDTISDSDTSASANHKVQFTMSAGGSVTEGETITITFPSGFDISGITEDDVDIADDGTQLTTEADCSGTASASFGIAGQVATFTICAGDGGAIAASSLVQIWFGTSASNSGTGSNQVTNHSSTGSYEINIGGTMSDFGTTRIVIIDDVLVTLTVGTNFTFTVSGVAASQTVNGDAVTTSSASTATLLDFETMTSGSPKVIAQDLSVQTNARNGFVVTVVQDHALRTSESATIDLFIDGASTSTPAAWQSPSADDTDQTTWGHMGITSEDADLNGDEFGSALYAGNIHTARTIFSNTGPANGSTANRGSTRVGIKMEITSLQEAGTYTNSLTYVATPTF